MLLAIDCGNTNIVFALVKDKKIIHKWRFETNIERTYDEYAVLFSNLLNIENIKFNDIKHIIIATVVPDAVRNLKIFCEKYISNKIYIIGENIYNLGIKINIDNPKEAGSDRLLNAIAVKYLYSKASIVVDFGTATTFDVILKNGQYEGGIIAPGVNLSLETLYNSASQLPKISLKYIDNLPIIGKNTVNSMKSGIYWGYLSLIEGLLKKIKDQYNHEFKVVATGGLSNLFYDSNLFDVVNENLTIIGLMYVFEENKQKSFK